MSQVQKEKFDEVMEKSRPTFGITSSDNETMKEKAAAVAERVEAHERKFSSLEVVMAVGNLKHEDVHHRFWVGRLQDDVFMGSDNKACVDIQWFDFIVVENQKLVENDKNSYYMSTAKLESTPIGSLVCSINPFVSECKTPDGCKELTVPPEAFDHATRKLNEQLQDGYISDDDSQFGDEAVKKRLRKRKSKIVHDDKDDKGSADGKKKGRKRKENSGDLTKKKSKISKNLTPQTGEELSEALSKKPPSILPTIHTSSHPIILDKITTLRSPSTNPETFRSVMKQITQQLGYEATKTLNVQTVTVPRQSLSASVHSSESKNNDYNIGAKLTDKVALVPILLSGLVMVDSFLELLPNSKVHHVDVLRGDNKPDLYFHRWRPQSPYDVAYVLDPMVGNGATVSKVVKILKKEVRIHRCSVFFCFRFWLLTIIVLLSSLHNNS